MKYEVTCTAASAVESAGQLAPVLAELHSVGSRPNAPSPATLPKYRIMQRFVAGEGNEGILDNEGKQSQRDHVLYCMQGQTLLVGHS